LRPRGVESVSGFRVSLSGSPSKTYFDFTRFDTAMTRL
jgi:hypothetical protein